MRVDVHCHYYPRVYIDRLEELGRAVRRMTNAVPGFSFALGIDRQVELLDAAGIQAQVLSVGNQPPYFPELEQAVSTARLVNDLYADLCARFTARFHSFGALPLPHLDAALAELERCLDSLGFVGIGLGSSVLEQPLDSPAFDALFAELDRRGCVVFIHPVGAGGGLNSADFGLTWMLGSRFEDTITAARLILSGLTLKYPRIRFIIPHLGGTLPLFLQRMDNVAERQDWHSDLKPSDLLRRMWFDSVNEHPVALRCACEAFGVDRLLLGTDWPFLPADKLQRCVTYVEEALPSAEASAILDRNAASLLGLAVSV
jgi:predicted TIM-barrel fold metal-dependent hydrolase